ncbi:MAG: ornithine carbamoyltransferase [Phycisphaerales bacterium]
MKHFLSIADATTEELKHILAVSKKLRDERDAGKANKPVLAGKTLAMLFEKPSLRTRVSFEQAMIELGGHSIVMGQEVGLGKREAVSDVAKVLGGMVHGIAARVFEHQKLIDFAAYAGVPVVNMLSDLSHPCQALADLMTIQDEFGADLAGRSVAFIGDGNNVAYSVAVLCGRLGVRFVLASPDGYAFSEQAKKQIMAGAPQLEMEITEDPIEAVKGVDAVFTDTFTSMGQEAEKETRLKAFKGYQVNEGLLAHAADHAIVLHCLPAYRGVEITDEVMDGPRSRVFPEAHNRLHAQKGLLAVLMGGM